MAQRDPCLNLYTFSAAVGSGFFLREERMDFQLVHTWLYMG